MTPRQHYEVLFTRHAANPILTADDWPYPAHTVFNAGATRLQDGTTLLLCRVEDRRGHSHLCAARSANGIDVDHPVVPAHDKRGMVDGVDDHLTGNLFDTGSTDESLRLTSENFAEVAYASGRVLHAWDTPAYVAGRPYIDAFYTNACPALELAELGYQTIYALATEPILYRDIFQDEVMPKSRGGAAIQVITPDFDPAELGVKYTGATEQGLVRVFNHGLEKGKEFLV